MYEPLTVMNRRIKQSTPVDPRPSIIRSQYGSYQVCLSSEGCPIGAEGSCTMCNYGRGRRLTVECARDVADDIVARIPEGTRSVLLGTYGSILDTDEVPADALVAILDIIDASDGFGLLILETSYRTVTAERMEVVKAHVRNHPVCIEMGLESADPEVLAYSLNKSVDPDGMRRAIGTIHGCEFTVALNIVVGAPFLSYAEQVGDAVSSIRWAVENGADDVIVFPMNVKDHTLLRALYDSGGYDTVTQWEMVDVLKTLDASTLSRISVSWSDAESLGERGCVYPKSCPACSERLSRMYAGFMAERDGSARRRLLDSCVRDDSCICGTAYCAYPAGSSIKNRVDIWIETMGDGL